MKAFKLLTLAFCTILVLSAGCKKDNTEKELPKLKSVMQVAGSAEFKTEFEYDSDWRLKQSRQFEDGLLQTYVDYLYNGTLTEAKTFEKASNDENKLLAVSNFSFQAEKLTKVVIRFVDSSPGNTSTYEHTFSYSNGEIPVMTTQSSGIPFNLPVEVHHPNAGGIHFTDAGIELDDMTTTNLTADTEADRKHNPFYNLPFIATVQLTLWSPIQSRDEYFHYFDAGAFFRRNNITKASSAEPNGFTFTAYTYNELDLPVKSITTNSISSVKIERTFEYW